ncbi:TPA: prepilin-type N-terminal cleavage/methylation domain-containing protein, partial [Campylobacter fetus]|nr:prepilin-type N-terminal cleavage/methylation domain-containing protein [Campylobacter fetus subsp. venerealis]HDX8146837.1 prepilin-type N-terminal cleavage/methylation domain-containing protein [Campylobacter fetus]
MKRAFTMIELVVAIVIS